MNKAELISAIVAKTNLTKVDAKKALDAFIEVSGETLKKGDKLTLVGFGSFAVAKRNARNGRNPRTGAKIKIVAKKVVKFRPGRDISKKINK